jgi:rod shape-determining protein MreD
VRHLAFIGIILALAALQSALGQVAHVDVARPLLTVPLVLYFALHLNTVEGALLAAAAGLASDASGGFVTGLATFTLVFLFVATRIVLAGLRGEGIFFDMLFAAALAGAYHVATLALTRLFGPSQAPLSDLPWVRTAAWSALATALATPFVVALARRADRIGARQGEMLSS